MDADALRSCDVDVVAQTATITGTAAWIKGLGAVQPSPKTAAGYRVIALPLGLLDLIVSRFGLEWPHNDLGLVFPNLWVGREIRTQSASS